ncbi:MAG: dephospho-CoA kinase, partial [Marinobacter sp.]
VFDAPEERAWLEGLLHPVIREELMRQLHPDSYALPYVLLVSPLLLETDQHELVEKIVVVDVPVDVQVQRTMARDTNDREQVERIIAAQMPREQRLQKADNVVDNNLPMADVEQEVEALHQTFLAAFGR